MLRSESIGLKAYFDRSSDDGEFRRNASGRPRAQNRNWSGRLKHLIEAARYSQEQKGIPLRRLERLEAELAPPNDKQRALKFAVRRIR